MPTLFASHEFDMDISHLDDKMEIGTSPYPQIDDIDFDFEPIRQQSVDRSMADDAEVPGNNTDAMQAEAEIEDMYKDDDMFEDETTHQSHKDDNDLEDLNMESYEGENTNDQDEEILYDDEDTELVHIDEQQDDRSVEESVTQTANVEPNVEIGEVFGALEDIENDGQSITNIAAETSEQDRKTQGEMNEKLEVQDVSTDANNNIAAEIEVLDFAAQEEANESGNVEIEHTKSVTDNIELDSTGQPFGHPQVDADAQQGQSLVSPNVFTNESTTQVEDVKETRMEHEEPGTEDSRASRSTDPLHPVTVLYQGQEMSLFPPMIEDPSATFFLSDSGLAHEPVEKLLASCRDILGETLEHDDELVLDVHALGLHICEDSKYAGQITLAQIVDVYLTLSRNESIDNIEALYCNLSSRVCLASQYAYLAASATEGKTFSEIAAEHVDSPENDENTVQEAFVDSNSDHTDELASTVPTQAENGVEIEDEQLDQGIVNESEDKTTYDLENSIVESGVREEESGQTSSNGPEEAKTQADDQDQLETEVNLAQGPGPEQDLTVESNAEQRDHSTLNIAEVQAEAKNAIELNHVEEADAYFDGDEAVEAEESGSLSSHTVEGEDTIESIEQAHSNLDYDVRDNNKQSHDDSDIYNLDEGLFDEAEANPNGAHHNDQPDSTSHQRQGSVTKDAKSDHHSPAHAHNNLDFEEDGLAPDVYDTESADGHNQFDIADEIDFLLQEDATAEEPITPSKQNGSKRKALDVEDDLDFLDFSTPEPKRTRAS